MRARGDEITLREIDWLVEGEVAYGLLSAFLGRSAAARAAALAAMVTKRAEGVVWVAGDEPAWRARNALGAASVAPDRVEIWTLLGDDEPDPVGLLDQVAERCDATQAGLVVVDPLEALIDAALDPGRERRQVVRRLARMADEQDVAVIVVTERAPRVAALVIIDDDVTGGERPEDHDAQDATGPVLEEACRFLIAALADGPRRGGEVLSEARTAGMSAITIRRAREWLGVRVTRRGRASTWELPS